MPIYVQSPRATTADALCIPMELTGWSEYEGQTAAVGRRLDFDHRGETIVVVLTTRDKNSQNRNRRSLDEWRNGFRAFNEHFRLEVGGIVSFKDCRRLADRAGNGVYVSSWPNILAGNREQVQNVVRGQHVVMRVTVRSDGTGWGDVVVFYPEEAVQCDTDVAVADHARRLASAMNVPAPMFVLRALNKNNDVLAATHVTPKYTKRVDHNREVFVAPTPEEIGTLARSYAGELRKLSPEITAFNVLPADRFPLSAHTMLGADRIESTELLTKGFRSRDVTGQEIYVAKEALMKLSAAGESGAVRFVNGVYPVNRFGRGANPDLLGGFVYASNAVFSPIRLANGSLTDESHLPERVECHERGVEPRVDTTRRSGVAVSSPEAGDLVARQGRGASTNAKSEEAASRDDPFAGVPSAASRRPRM